MVQKPSLYDLTESEAHMILTKYVDCMYGITAMGLLIK